MASALISRLFRILPMVTEGEVRDLAVPNGTTTSAIFSIPTIHARELVVMVESDVNVTLVKRIKGLTAGITVDRTQAVTGGTNLLNQDTAGLGQELQILITNASGGAAVVSVWAAARM